MHKTLLLLFVFVSSFVRAIELSDSSRISLLTVAPGTELYSTFGHSGIRVTDYKQNFDVVFNYGTFDFNQPNFYVNFVKGRLLYMVDVESFRNFMSMYVYEERAVVEDELNLSTTEKQNIFAFLANNAKPENRDYPYEFFFDNCATRIRDVFENELKQKLTLHYTSFDTTLTLKQMLDLYVYKSPWAQFGFYLILGLPCEITATPRIQTFLPDYLQKALQTATIQTESGTENFVTSTKVILDYPPAEMQGDFFSPIVVMLLLLLTIGLFSLLEYKSKKHFLIIDITLFGIAGLLGCFFLAMWFLTEHYSVEKNLNMLWAIPIHLPASITLLFKSQRKKLSVWFLITSVFMLMILLFKSFSPQPFHTAVLLFVAILSFRALLLHHYLKKLS